MSVYHYHGGMDDEVRITLRLPAGIHALLTTQARTGRRSLNAEIVHLMEAALGDIKDAGPPDGESATPDPLRGKPDSSPA